MKWGISRKLFLVFLISNTLLVGGISIAVHTSFEQGFLDYVNRLESNRLNTLQEHLAQHFEQQESWQAMRQNRNLWRDSLRAISPSPRSHRSSPDLPYMAPRLTLVDAQGHHVAGNPRPDSQPDRLPIASHGETVGYLLVRPLKLLTEDMDLEFQARQTRVMLVVLLVSLVVSLSVSALLAKHLVAPIRRIAQATHSLASGRYDTRITATTADELGELGEDFNRLAASLEQHDRLRREWTADISHELRTPLAVIRGEIEALQDGVRPLNQAALASLHSETGLLAKLVDDLYQLTLSDVGALNYRKEPLDLHQSLLQAVELYRPDYERRGLALRLEPLSDRDSMTIFGDPTRLQQLFQNLLQNSLRYTDAPGHLHIHWNAQADGLDLFFDDSGPDVPESALPHLFERLYRVDASRNRALGGAGLGLAICRNIVTAHGGEITAAPSPLGGLRIHISLPHTTA